MGIEDSIFNRLTLLLGTETMDVVARQRVIIFGVGGVGSWCAESLVRSGIRHLTLVDSDCVCITNINRQLQATTRTVGKVKVEVLKERLLDINPKAEINAIQEIYSADNAASFQLDTYDYIIDAIDSLKDKVHLILQATQCKGKFFSAMGAALKALSQRGSSFASIPRSYCPTEARPAPAEPVPACVRNSLSGKAPLNLPTTSGARRKRKSTAPRHTSPPSSDSQ